jgi:hypothetical protein
MLCDKHALDQRPVVGCSICASHAQQEHVGTPLGPLGGLRPPTPRPETGSLPMDKDQVVAADGAADDMTKLATKILSLETRLSNAEFLLGVVLRLLQTRKDPADG